MNRKAGTRMSSLGRHRALRPATTCETRSVTSGSPAAPLRPRSRGRSRPVREDRPPAVRESAAPVGAGRGCGVWIETHGPRGRGPACSPQVHPERELPEDFSPLERAGGASCLPPSREAPCREVTRNCKPCVRRTCRPASHSRRADRPRRQRADSWGSFQGQGRQPAWASVRPPRAGFRCALA